jgi:HprK-related kinase A
MRVGDLTSGDLRARLQSDGLRLQMGPFVIRVQTSLPSLADLMHRLYTDYFLSDEEIADFHVRVDSPTRTRRWIKPQAQFFVDGYAPFERLPLKLALPALEWGINWCIATRSNQYLMLHSAVVAKDDGAMLFPAWPGHGKSTLCTALVHTGWRLLSDEFGIFRLEDHTMQPLPRLTPLKNESIEVIRQFAPKATIGPLFEKTRKGTIAHVHPPQESLESAQETSLPRWLVFPKWEAGAPLELEPMKPAPAFLMVATNAFNYEVLCEQGYLAVRHLINQCNCYRLTYSDLPEALAALDNLTAT